MTNTITLITVLLTNWVATGDTKHQHGTNYVELQAVVTQQVLIQEVKLCTNYTVYRTGASTTNGVRWESNPIPSPLPLPPSPSLGFR